MKFCNIFFLEFGGYFFSTFQAFEGQVCLQDLDGGPRGLKDPGKYRRD